MSKEIVEIFDTTLRDGEQAAGTRLGAREKVEIARQLVRLNVDIIEAGFPASSPEDFEAVRLISEQIEGPVICGLTRARIDDIEVCQKALAKAKRARIHTGIGVSEIHIMGKFADDKYGKTMGEKQATILKMAVEAVKHTGQYVDDIEFYAEDSGRADRKFLYEILEAVIDAGATVLNIPDTTGYSIPEQWGALIRDIRTNVPNIAKATISVHCHNDLGMAVANSLAGVKNGARQVEGTITSDQVVVSLAAGVPTSRFEEAFPGVPVVRAMPNTPAQIDRGITALCGGIHTDERSLGMAESVLSAVGETIVLDEYLLDAVTAVSGTGPAYVFHMIEAMAKAGVAEGLAPDLALTLATETVRGAGVLAATSDLAPGTLRENVTSPGGTTQAALDVLMGEGRLEKLIAETVKAAAKRSRELGS